MIARRSPRWALSFADLCLLLLGFLLILQTRPDGTRLAAGMRAAFSGARPPHAEQRAAALFEPGEAILNRAGHALLAGFVHDAGQARISLASRGTDGGSARFDGWELAAARAAAIAREFGRLGITQDRVTLTMGGAAGRGQTLILDAR